MRHRRGVPDPLAEVAANAVDRGQEVVLRTVLGEEDLDEPLEGNDGSFPTRRGDPLGEGAPAACGDLVTGARSPADIIGRGAGEPRATSFFGSS